VKKNIKVVADDKIPFLKGVLEPYADILYMPGRDISSDQIRDADAIIIRTRTKCNKELLEGSKVRFIATATIGFDHIDTDYCTSRKITWQNAPGCNSSSVEQYVLAALSVLSEGKNFSLAGSTIGIIGAGHVGTKIKRIAELLGMNILLNDPPRERREGGSYFVSLEHLVQESDIISFHVPLTMSGQDKTFHMVNNRFLNDLRKKVHLINTSRGEIIEENALKNAISCGMLGSVVLDVWENEPFADKDLLEMVNIGTPHIAGYSLDGKANGTGMSVRALDSFFHLGLDNWSPDAIPMPLDNKIILDAAGKNKELIIKEAVLRTYNILDDDAIFRKSISSFEEQREHYPPRREYGAYNIRLLNDHDDAGNVLMELGFNVTGYS
jgi:erythronate-4-phosphate dehydrogenase